MTDADDTKDINEIKKKKFEKMLASIPNDDKQPITNHKIIFYSTSSCPYCTMAKQYVKELGVDYEEYDVGTDKERAKEMVKKSGQMGVPVIDIDGHIVVGFNRPLIDKLLGV